MGKGSGAVKRAPGGVPSIGFAGGNPCANGSTRHQRPACGSPARRLPSGSRYSPESRMRAILWLINTIITIYIWLLIAQAVLSWLLAFGVINRYNRSVSVIGDF